MSNAIQALLAFGTVAFVGGLILWISQTVRCYRSHKKLNQCFFLSKHGWKITFKRNHFDGENEVEATATDEVKSRTLDEAYERQLTLNEIKRLNLPLQETPDENKYIAGNWK